MISEWRLWLDALAAGDAVGCFDLRGTRLVYRTTVAKRTPTGRIVCANGAVFEPDGWLRGSHYLGRSLGPLTGEM